MKSFHLVAALALAQGVWSQFTVPPDTPADPNTIKDCTWWHVVSSGDTCASIASDYGLTAQQFAAYNPSVAGACNLIVGNSYCIEQNWGEPPAGGTTTTTPPPATTTTPGNGITTPTPTQEGMVSNCNRFHLVVSGDGCSTIQTRYGVTLSQLVAWNPAIGSTCTNLWLNTYVCVGVIGGVTTTTRTSTTTTPATTTTPGNGITTPTPIQDGMVRNCDRFHFVVSGDQCGAIATRYNIPLATFYSWNPAVGNTCASLWLNTYVCVRTIGYVPPTTTTTGNGISTPTPTQPGMINNCNRFHKVVSGDQCGSIASRYGISLANFYSWNPGVGNNCQTLWLDTYCCVGRL